MSKPPKLKSNMSAKDKEHLGQMLVNIYESGYIDRNQMYKMTFVKGLIAGLGGVLGATIIVGLLIWFLSLFDTTPLIGPMVHNIKHTVETKQTK